MDSEKDKIGETETCTGQCGYSPICRQCELEKKKLMMEKYAKHLPEEPSPDDGVS